MYSKNIDLNKKSNSEESSDNEKMLLKRACKKTMIEKYDSEDEIIKFSDRKIDYNRYGKNLFDFKNEDLKEDFDLLNTKTWGKKKTNYYSTDYIDSDYNSVSQKDITDSKMEEQEALIIQKRLIEFLDEDDFGLDLVIENNFSLYNNEYIKTDFSKLSTKQKQQLLETENPEFMNLLKDFKDRLKELKTFLVLDFNLIKSGTYSNYFIITFIQIKIQLLLLYCSNICFYCMLKAIRKNLNIHPVIKRLSHYRRLIIQLDSSFISKKVKNSVEKIEKLPLNITRSQKISDQIVKSVAVRYQNKSLVNNSLNTDNKNNLKQDLSSTFILNEYRGNDNDNEQRIITYQIAKNKGLLPQRKKEQRNPRVKHRNSYRKAQIRRKGAVKEVRKEISRYGGEISGIKASVSRSIKFK